MDQRRLVVAEVNLVLNAVGGIDDRLDCSVYDFPGVHIDFDFVADFWLFFRHAPEFYYTLYSPAGPVPTWTISPLIGSLPGIDPLCDANHNADLHSVRSR